MAFTYMSFYRRRDSNCRDHFPVLVPRGVAMGE